MTVRTSRKTVTFKQPFTLRGIDEVQPAGTYVVETDEALLPGLSFLAYRRQATLISLPSKAGGALAERVVEIDPLELEVAQKKDAGLPTPGDGHELLAQASRQLGSSGDPRGQSCG